MKKLFTLIFLFHFTAASSQSYYPLLRDSVYWDVFHFTAGPICDLSDASRYFLDGTVQVNGYDYRVIKYHPIIAINYPSGPFCWPFAVDGSSTLQSIYLIREDTSAQKVYVYLNGQEYLAYDFTLQVGDTMNTTYHIYDWVVDSIGTYLMPDGTSRRIYYGSPSSTSNVQFFIEGVGSSTGLFYPFAWAIGAGYALSCVLENNIPIYDNPQHPLGCIGFVGINELFNYPELEIFPNPASDILNIRPINNRGGLFKIFDIAGRLIYETLIFNETKQIELDYFRNGIYFSQFESPGKLTLNGKLVIQK